MTRLLYILCLVFNQCAFAVGTLLHVSQPETAVRVQPGYPAALTCYAPEDGLFKIFWLKFRNCSTPVLVAMATSDKSEIIKEETFQNPSKYRLTWNKLSFNLSILYVEKTDIAIYFCGTVLYNRMHFGNGTTVMFDEHFNETEPTQEKGDNLKGEQIFVYAVLTLVTISVMSVLLNITLFYILKKHRAGMSQTYASQKQETAELNYAALTFAHNQSTTKQRLRKDRDTQVIYKTVRHQEIQRL